MFLSLTICIVLKENKVPERFLVSFLMRYAFVCVINYSCVFSLDFRGAPVWIENLILFNMAERS